MKKLLISILLTLFIFPTIASAVRFDVNQLRAIIEANDIVQVNKNIIFDASQSFILNTDEPIKYEWDFGDNADTKNEEEAVHMYKEPGEYQVKLTITQGEESSSVLRDILVYKKLVLFLTDVSEKQENIEKLAGDARKEGTFIKIIDSYDSATAFISEEALTEKLIKQVKFFSNTEYIIIWTRRGSGINALTRLVRERSEAQKFLKEKTIIVISEENLNTMGRIMQSNFNIIQPKQIIITRKHKLENLITSSSAEEFLSELEKSISEYKIINEETGRVSIFNSISYLVNFMITKGIPSNTIVLLLMLPVIATIIAFLKQVVGITTFGLYLPSIITLSFLALGLKFGLIILVIIIVTGAILRKALYRFRLLHIPRIAIILTISTLIILLMLAFGTYLGSTYIASIAVFPMLIMTTLAEKFVSALSGKGFFAALFLMLETTVVSLICYWVVEWQYLQNLILGHPEIILVLIVINLILGRWTGLRLAEYVRFREVMKHTEE